jgi:hypothetical protein
MRYPEPQRPRLYVVGNESVESLLEELSLPLADIQGSSFLEFIAGASVSMYGNQPTELEIEDSFLRLDVGLRILVYEDESRLSINPLHALIFLSERGQKETGYLFVKELEDGILKTYKVAWIDGENETGGWYFGPPLRASRGYSQAA